MSLRDKLSKIHFATWGKRVAITVAVLLAAFMIVSNVMLRTRAFRDLMTFDPESMTVDYDSAYSWFPCRIHVENLRVRGSDSHVQWLVTVARADTFMNPLALARRRFSASHATASGITVRLRTRFLPDDVAPERLAALPEIPGYADPPLVVPVPPDPADPDYALWSVDLEDVTAHDITDVWIDSLHETGAMNATGRWFFRPLRELDFGPSTLETAHVDLKNRDRELAMNVVGSARLRIFSYDVRLPKGYDLLRQFSGDAKLSWQTPLAGAFADLVGAPLEIRHGLLAVDGEIRMDRGVLISGSRAHADVDALDMTLDPVKTAIQTTSSSDFVVDESGLLTATISSEKSRVEKEGAPAANIESIVSTITSRHLDLVHGFDDAHARIEARGVDTESLERWIAPQNHAPAYATGAFRVDADLETQVSDPDFHGHVDLAVHDATLAAGPVRTMSAVHALIDFDHLSPRKRWIAASIDARTPDPILTVLDNLRLRSRLAAHGRVDAHLGDAKNVELSNAELKWIDARADFNAKPLFVAPAITIRSDEIEDHEGHWKGHVDFDAPRVDMPSLAALASIAPFPADTEVVGGAATAHAHASLDLATMAADGNVDLLARNVDVRIDKTPFFGNLQLGARAVRRGGVADFSGSTIVLARGNDARAPRGAEPWSATFTLPEARLTNAGGPAFYAKIRGDATDASPATLFVSSATGIPEWITNAFRMRGLRVTGDVIVAPSFFAVRGLDARGDNEFVDLEYSRRGPMKDGALYLGTGILTGGIDLAGGGARLVPFGAKSWFLHDVEKIRANEISLP